MEAKPARNGLQLESLTKPLLDRQANANQMGNHPDVSQIPGFQRDLVKNPFVLPRQRDLAPQNLGTLGCLNPIGMGFPAMRSGELATSLFLESLTSRPVLDA